MVSVMVYPCMFCVALPMDLFVCVLAACELFGETKLFAETIRNMFGCGCYYACCCSILMGSGALCLLVCFLLSKFTRSICLMHLVMCLRSNPILLYLAFVHFIVPNHLFSTI